MIYLKTIQQDFGEALKLLKKEEVKKQEFETKSDLT